MSEIGVGVESSLSGVDDSGCWGSESDDIPGDGDSCRGCLCIGWSDWNSSSRSLLCVRTWGSGYGIGIGCSGRAVPIGLSGC